MSEPRLVRAAPAPLFERLTDLQPDIAAEAQPLTMLSPEAVRESVLREIQRLLNTRAPVAAPVLERRIRSTIDYGIPDLSVLGTRDFDSETKFVNAIRQALEAYEPRLTAPSVRLARSTTQNAAVLVQVKGELHLGSIREPVSFEVAVDTKGPEYD